MQSVLILILVLCCMASADNCNAIYDKAVQADVIRQTNHTNCSISTQNRCEDAWKIYGYPHHSCNDSRDCSCDDINYFQYTWIHSILDIICSDDCIKILDSFYDEYLYNNA